MWCSTSSPQRLLDPFRFLCVCVCVWCVWVKGPLHPGYVHRSLTLTRPNCPRQTKDEGGKEVKDYWKPSVALLNDRWVLMTWAGWLAASRLQVPGRCS